MVKSPYFWVDTHNSSELVFKKIARHPHPFFRLWPFWVFYSWPFQGWNTWPPFGRSKGHEWKKLAGDSSRDLFVCKRWRSRSPSFQDVNSASQKGHQQNCQAGNSTFCDLFGMLKWTRDPFGRVVNSRDDLPNVWGSSQVTLFGSPGLH